MAKTAPATGLFILLGILMATSGMATRLASTLAGIGPAYIVIAPLISALGGFLTGSNSGANAMFAATQAGMAHALAVNLLRFMAVQNVASAFLLMASPGKIEMALHLTPHLGREDRGWMQARIFMTTLPALIGLILADLLVATGIHI